MSGQTTSSAPPTVASLIRSVGVAAVAPVLLGVIGAPLLARAMQPGDRGVLGAALAAATIANVLALGGSAEQLPKDLARIDHAAVWSRFAGTLRSLAIPALLVSVATALFAMTAWSVSAAAGLFASLTVLASWFVGVGRAVLTGIGWHGPATRTYVSEAVTRLSAIIVLITWSGDVGVAAGLAASGLAPPIVASLVLVPRLRAIRAAARATEQGEPRFRHTGYSAVAISLSQQFMGRSVLAVWALFLADEAVGFLVVAFALTEPTINFARVGQPFVIQRAEAGRARLLPWVATTSLAAALSALGGVIVLEPFFGSEYASAVDLVVPLAVSQGLFSVAVLATGEWFVLDRRTSIRSMQLWQAASVSATVLVAAASGSAVVVAWTFAAMAGGQAAWSLRKARRAGRPNATVDRGGT